MWGIFKKIKLAVTFNSAYENIKEVYMAQSTATKPGWKTSEFWLSALTILGSLFGALQGKIPDTVAEVGAAVVTAGYAIARAITKKGTTTPTTPVQ